MVDREAEDTEYGRPIGVLGVVGFVGAFLVLVDVMGRGTADATEFGRAGAVGLSMAEITAVVAEGNRMGSWVPVGVWVEVDGVRWDGDWDGVGAVKGCVRGGGEGDDQFSGGGCSDTDGIDRVGENRQ